MEADEPQITELQWEAARVAFMESLHEKEGMPPEKYNQILELLTSWDDLTPSCEFTGRFGMSSVSSWKSMAIFCELMVENGYLL